MIVLIFKKQREVLVFIDNLRHSVTQIFLRVDGANMPITDTDRSSGDDTHSNGRAVAAKSLGRKGNENIVSLDQPEGLTDSSARILYNIKRNVEIDVE